MLVAGGVRTGSKSVWAYNDDGTSLWSYDTGGIVHGVAINDIGHIFVCGAAADNSDGNGTRNMWKLDIEGTYLTGAYVDSNANAWDIAVDSNYVYVSHGAGADRYSPALGSQSQILGVGGACQAINVDTSGNIYIGGGGIAKTLYKYDSALAQQWVEDTNDSLFSIDFLAGGDLIVGTSDNEVRKYLADGTSPSAGTWAWVHPTAGHHLRAAVDSNDNIYVVAFNSAVPTDKRFVALNSSGVLQWEIDRADDIEDIVITIADAIYVVGDDTGSYSGFSVDVTGQSLTDLIEDDSTTFKAVAWSPLTITEGRYKKTLVAIGNKEVWYGSSVGQMVEFVAANDDFSTSKALTAIEAYGKIFIANETNLKVFDFVNTKINTTDAGVNPCTRSMVLTGGTSAAVMVVDYVDGVTDNSAANVYGKRTSVQTFSSGETVTGTNSDNNAVSFATSAAEVASPHWYNWTVFGNDTTTYGTMPTSSSLVSLYRGRLVLNDDDNPHAWYMFAVGNPFKILYDFTNDEQLSAVTYANGRVGLVGDILTTYIAISDDLFIFGCQNSIWVLVGDPLAEGQLTQLTADTGIWGSRAWCVDGQSNLYFFGNDGVYQCSISNGLTKPKNISKLKLPTLVADLDLDKSLHRVVLAFDPVNNGVVITRTLLSDGTNTGYWLSLTTGGFFPESFPASCGIFSAHYFPATDETYKNFLVGCADGYIREFDNSTKNDDTTSSIAAISSYCLLLQKLGIDDNHKGMLREITGITGGGAAGGDFSDTDSVAYSLFSADDAETLIEDVIDGATAFSTGTWSGTGKQDRIRPRLGGVWAGIQLANSTASETWAINSVSGEVIPKGKI